MRKNLYLLLILSTVFTSCYNNKKMDEGSIIPVIDINYSSYPVETKNLHEIADVEYIPLETTEKSLMAVAGIYSVSDEYIITQDIAGNVWLFDRSGKFLSTFNKVGNGPEEYNEASRLVCDFDNQEIFIYDRTLVFKVYTFKGEYKRTLKFPQYIGFDLAMYNYNSDYLIVYNDQYFRARKDIEKAADNHPYYLIGKKDGKMIPVPLHFNERISSAVHKEIEIFPGGAWENATQFPIYSFFNNGSEIIISDFALDTIYSYTNMVLTPIACRKPPVLEKKPPRIVVAEFDTDYFTKYRIVDMIYEPSSPYKHYDESLEIVWDKRKKKFAKWMVYDLNYTKDRIIFPDKGLYSSLPKNHGRKLYSAENLIERYKNNQLSGKLKEIASKLKDDDNPVLVIAKYK